MSSVRATGKVKFFSDEKGFGFIVPDQTGPELFVHRTDLGPTCSQSVHGEKKYILKPDQAVSYEEAENSRKGNGKRATSVELV